MAYPDLDIIIPVYNEAENIIAVLDSLKQKVKTSSRILICYDNDDDNTLPVVRKIQSYPFDIMTVKNAGIGVHGAIMTGFLNSSADAVLVFPADDTYNAGIIDKMYDNFKAGSEIVAASRFMKGGTMKGCPILKSIFVRIASFTLHWFAFIPIKDASNGFRLFSRKVLRTIPIESTVGFTYSIELLVKCHRLRWKITEVPASWFERKNGRSRFDVIKWLPYYLKWYLYGFQTFYFKRKL
jgi:dolichol-phosphate mannosyltransferase